MSLAVVVLLAACQSHYARVEELRRPVEGARIMLMPPDIELYEIGAFGAAEPRAEWTEAAKAHLVEALRQQKAARGLRLVDYDPSRVRDGLNEIEIVRTSGTAALYFAIEARYFSREKPIRAAANEIFARIRTLYATLG